MSMFSFVTLDTCVRIKIHLMLLFGENPEREEHRVQILFYGSISRPPLSSKFFSFKITTHFNRFTKNLAFLSRFSANTREQHSHVICCKAVLRLTAKNGFQGLLSPFRLNLWQCRNYLFRLFYFANIYFIYVFCFFNAYQSQS